MPPFLTDKEMAERLGRPTKRLEFIILADETFHRVADGWEAYPPELQEEKE